MINFAKINIVFRISLCRTEIRCKENTLVAVQNKGVDSLISFFFFLDTMLRILFIWKIDNAIEREITDRIFPLLEITSRIFFTRGNFYREFDSWKWLIEERIFQVEIASHKNYAWFKELYKRSISYKIINY